MPNTPLRIATFNLENFDDGPELPRRIAALRPLLVRADADVLLLQEVHSQGDGSRRNLSALDQLFEGTRYAGYERASTRTADGLYGHERNLVVVSRFPILETKQHKNTLCPAPMWRRWRCPCPTCIISMPCRRISASRRARNCMSP